MRSSAPRPLTLSHARLFTLASFAGTPPSLSRNRLDMRRREKHDVVKETIAALTPIFMREL